MTSRVLVLGDPAYDYPLAVEKMLQSAYLHVRPLSETPPELATMGAEGPEQWAASWWTQHGLRMVPAPNIAHPYKLMHHYVSAFPDVVLIFGESKFLTRAAERCTRYQIEPVIVP